MGEKIEREGTEERERGEGEDREKVEREGIEDRENLERGRERRERERGREMMRRRTVRRYTWRSRMSEGLDRDK